MKKPLTEYQQKLVKNYYKNIDGIMLDKLGEIVSDLFIAETESKQNRLWKRARQAMLNLKVPPSIIEHIMNKKDVKILAKNLSDWLAQKK